MLFVGPCSSSAVGFTCSSVAASFALTRHAIVHVSLGPSFCASLFLARRAGLYRWQICMAAAQNCLYGSTLSPPRQQQVREACMQYWEGTTLEQDSVFQMLCPFMCKQMKIDSNDPIKVDSFYRNLRNHSLLWAKGERVPCFFWQCEPKFVNLGPCNRSQFQLSPIALRASPFPYTQRIDAIVLVYFRCGRRCE